LDYFMKLYLVQHGEACAKNINPERPLTVQGKADIERLTAFLNQAGVKVERVIHSGKLRARQTAEIMASRIAPGVKPEESGMLNPNDNPKAFDWQSESWSSDMLVVGHLPFLASLVSHLLVDDVDRFIVDFQPGSIVCLEHVDKQWQLDWMIRPELLK
jgi:phosphohistidine phosphatase